MQIIDNFRQKFSTDPYFKFRTIVILLAVFLGLCSILLVFSMFSALFGIEFFPPVPGIFFVRSFGILSLFIPVYFAYAAVILADPRWRPDKIFFLSGSVIPFLTLAVGFAFIRDFEIRSVQFALLNFTGRTGFSLLIISLTVVEVLALQYLKNAIFFKEKVLIRRRVALLPPPLSVWPQGSSAAGDAAVDRHNAPFPVVSFTDESSTFGHILQDGLSGENGDVEELNILEEVDEAAQDADAERNENVEYAAGVTRALEEAEAAAGSSWRTDSQKKFAYWQFPL